MTKELWEGNRAIAEAAMRAGLEAFFGYPITPQTELLEYLAWYRSRRRSGHAAG